jgi:hypothetical protein
MNIVETRRRSRSNWARHAVEWRRKWGGIGFIIDREFYRHCKLCWNVPPKPSAANLLLEAKETVRMYLDVSYSNPHSDEYSTGCGYDDYMHERMREGRKYVCQLYRAALELGAEQDQYLEQVCDQWE